MKRQFAAHRDYSSIANCWTKITIMFHRIFGIFLRYFKICTYVFHITCGTPNNAEQNPGQEPLV